MNKTRRWPKIVLITAVILAIAIVGGSFGLRHLAKEQWVAQSVDTQAMSDARALTEKGRLVARSLQPQRTKKEKITLYSAILYPEVHSAVCTVDKPTQFKEFAAYLIAEDGTVYPGWYNPASMGEFSTDRHGIIKVFFEGLSTNRIVRLDVVDKSQVFQEYDPEKTEAKICFDLIPPEPESSSST